MAEVGAARTTQHFRPLHSERRIGRGRHVRINIGIPKTRPPGTGIKFCIRRKKRVPAIHTHIPSGRGVMEPLPATWRLGAFQKTDGILLRRELATRLRHHRVCR